MMIKSQRSVLDEDGLSLSHTHTHKTYNYDYELKYISCDKIFWTSWYA